MTKQNWDLNMADRFGKENFSDKDKCFFTVSDIFLENIEQD